MTKQEVLTKLAQGEIAVEDATRLLEQIDPSPRRGNNLYCKVSAKGALSVYGLQRMPVTLYVEQWKRLLDFADNVRKFIATNDADLKRKGQ